MQRGWSHSLLGQAQRHQTQAGKWQNLFRYRKKHFALQCGHAVDQLAQQGCDISISEAIQNTAGQFPEQPDLNGFSSQQKAELHGPPEVPANIN